MQRITVDLQPVVDGQRVRRFVDLSTTGSDMAKRIMEIHSNPSETRLKVERSLEYVSRNNWNAKKHVYLEILERMETA